MAKTCIGHVTSWSPRCHFLYRYYIATKSVFQQFSRYSALNILGSWPTLTFQGHVTSSVTWRFDSPFPIGGTEPLFPSVSVPYVWYVWKSKFRTTLKVCYSVSSVYVEGQSLLFFCHAPDKWGYGTATPKIGGTRNPEPPPSPENYAWLIVSMQLAAIATGQRRTTV